MITLFKNGITLANFHSWGKSPDVVEKLKIEHKESAIKSALSRGSLAEIKSRPVALDLQSLDRSENTLE